MGIGVLGTARCQHRCSPDYCVIELEALWTWYAPFRKRYWTRVKSKDHAKTLLEVPSGWDGGLEETQSSVTCSKTWSQTRKPSPLHSRHDSGQLDSGMKGFPRGCRNPCNLRVTGQALSQPPGPAAEPWGGVKKADGSGARRPRGGLAGSGFLPPSASWNGGPSRWVAAARRPGAPASQLASEPIPGGDFVMAEHSCICSDDPLICARKVRIILQIPRASPSIWLVALKVSHRFQHVKPPLQEYYCEEESRPWACRWTLLPCAFYFTVHTPRASRRAVGLRSLCCPALWEDLSTYYLEKKNSTGRNALENTSTPRRRSCVTNRNTASCTISETLMASPRQAGIR